MFQRRQATTRVKLGDSEVSSTQDMDAFFEAIPGSIGPASSKGYLTAADVMRMSGSSCMSKADKNIERYRCQQEASWEARFRGLVRCQCGAVACGDCRNCPQEEGESEKGRDGDCAFTIFPKWTASRWVFVFALRLSFLFCSFVF